MAGRASQLLVLVLVLCWCAAAVFAQTIQYSHGWTNGRKRSGASPLDEAVEARDADPDPCDAHWVNYVVAQRDGQQMYIPCVLWRNLREK